MTVGVPLILDDWQVGGVGGALCGVVEKWFLPESALPWGSSFPGPSTRERASAGVSCWHAWLPVSSAPSLGSTGTALVSFLGSPGSLPSTEPSLACFIYYGQGY